ncbi:hypothetical protein ACM1RC_32785 [Paenibacillus azoreducens]|uniref:hypothetical protein n=1 Tax=Paenibacillus azoreducens TaxID=116718 RepID=UPI0039F60E67
MDFTVITALISMCGVISGIIIGWSGRNRAAKQETKEEVQSDAKVRADIEYIKRGIEDIKYEQRAQGERFDELTERVTRVEESAKQAHKRIDDLKQQRGEDRLGKNKIQD